MLTSPLHTHSVKVFILLQVFFFLNYSSSCMSLPKIATHTHTVADIYFTVLCSPLFSKSGSRRGWAECSISETDRDSTQTHTMVWMQHFLIFIGEYNIIAGFQWGSSAFSQVDTERCFHNLFTMLQASEIVCKIIFCLSSTTVQIGQNPSMFDIHVISCCALRVDSTCRCLALHTIWDLFTSSSVIWWPSSTTDGTVWAVSLVYIVSTVSKWW